MITVPRKWWAGQFKFLTVDRENITDYARARLDILNEVNQVFSRNASVIKRCLVASFFFLNAGAAVKSFDATLPGHKHINLALMFLFGIILTLINGRLIQMIIVRQSAFFVRARAYWSSVASDNARDAAKEEALWQLSRKTYWQGIAIPILGLATACCIAWGYMWMVAP